MTEAVLTSLDASDIIGRIMAEMEEVFGLINRPLPHTARRAVAQAPESLEGPEKLAA